MERGPQYAAAGALLFYLLLLGGSPTKAQSESFCISEYYNKVPLPEGDHDLDDGVVRDLVSQVAAAIGVDGKSVTVVPCFQASKAESVYRDGSNTDNPAGDYILYDPDWVREVIGNDKWQAVALFGHELGHILNRHFTSRKTLARVEQETEADHFAGCAVARLDGSWDAVEDLFSRLRGVDQSIYPSRLQSLEAAELGFRACGGSLDNDAGPRTLPTSEEFINILQICGAGSGVFVAGDLEGSIQSIYDAERASLHGFAVQNVVAKVLELLPPDQRLPAYHSYLGCVANIFPAG